MKLSGKDSSQFFAIMLPLQLFVCRKMNLHPGVTTLESFRDKTTMMQKVLVRDEIFRNPALIDEFKLVHGWQYTKADLSILDGWIQHRVTGIFVVQQFLKNHTIFIQDDNVFAVLGLVSTIQEMLGRRALPLKVHANLLPFKGVIITDGFMGIQPDHIGSDMKQSFSEQYFAAKQNGTIITSLEDGII
jgi:hypothetical protein